MKQKQFVSIILPITLLFGVFILIATSIGPFLNAAVEDPLVQINNEEGIPIEEVDTKGNSQTVQMIAKKDGILELKYDERISILLMNEKKEESSFPIYPRETQTSKEIDNIFTNMAEEAERFYVGQNNEYEEKVACIQVKESESKGSFYFKFKKDQKQWITFERNTSESVEVNVSTIEGNSIKQQLVHFENLTKSIGTSTSSKVSEKVDSEQTQKSSAKQEEKKKKETIESIDESEGKKTNVGKENQTSELKSEEDSSQNSLNNDEKKVSYDANSREEAKVNKYEDGEPEKKMPELGTPESYNRILAVETKKTNATLDKLLKVSYKPEDSLKKPQYLVNTATNTENLKTIKADSPIIVRDVNLSVKTGTRDFDNDNAAGHDKDENNNIVRSFDQVSYLVSFSIQNTSMTKKYSNIRYRVIANLDEAVEIVNGVPRNNAEITNGTYVDKPDGTGAQYSEGVMESVISDTGQVFVPVFMNVFGSPNGKKLRPTIKLEIVDAVNVDTGKTETFNKVYGSAELPKLEIAETTVSAKPSVKVQLIKGDIKESQVVGFVSDYINAYDVGVVTTLTSLPERATGDFKGATFPSGPITYTIKQKGKYQIGNNPEQNMVSGQFHNMDLYGLAPAINDRTKASWTKKTGVTVKAESFNLPLDIPNAKTKKVYTSQPSGNLSEIGVYDSGSFTTGFTSSIAGAGTVITNSSYQGVVNPYTYNMTGNRTSDATANSFSSLELVYAWNKKPTHDIATAQKWTRYSASLYVDSVTYDGITTANDSSIEYNTVVSPSGSFAGGPTVGKGNSEEIISLNDTGGLAQNSGNSQVNRGDSIGFVGFPITTNSSIKTIKQIFMWDPTAFEYESSKEPFIFAGEQLKFSNQQFIYGVSKSLSTSAPYTMKVKDASAEWATYNWYTTPEAAKAAGKISAVFVTADYLEESYDKHSYVQFLPYIPVKVIGNSGSISPAGNPLVVLSAIQFIDSKSKIVIQQPSSGATLTYQPTKFDTSGGVISRPNQYWNWIGESIFIKNFSITTKTTVERSLYQTNEEINIKVNGVYTGSPSEKYDSSLNTILPKGIYYKKGTSKDALGNTLSDPVVTQNSDGTTTLRWDFTNVSLSIGSEVSFTAISDFSQLDFKDTGYTENLKVETVGEMWVKGYPTIKDESKESLRKSSDTFIENLVQQVLLSKKADKPIIEVGNNDPVGEDTSITYNVNLINESVNSILNARLLDVLPYNGDSRGTIFDGSYTVEEITVNDSNAQIYFTKSNVDENVDPNTISGWESYTPGVTPIASIKQAKAIMVNHASVPVGKSIELKVKIQPTGQKAGNVLVNNASMNSQLKLPVDSQTVWTRVYGRDLTGYVWYDNNYNGLIDSAEKPIGSIPVKLYRTSQKDTSYKKELVKESLSGQKYIDASGNSLIKTDSTGKYKFENLPEGKYLAEFIVGDLVTQKAVIVTKQLVGNDPTKNSKASPSDYKTPEYNHPELEELPALLTGVDKVQHITDINVGLTTLSKIRLFKYEEGTGIDSDGDGKLSGAEIEASGNPLKNAEFAIFKGNSTSSENKIGSAKTDSNGWLEFIGLLSGDYTLVETKAPDGFELLKDPIYVNVPTYNYVAIVHVADNGQTELPFTGGTKAMRFILIGAASLLVVGMTGIFLYFRRLT